MITRRFVGTVTSKLQKRREEFIRNKYPNYPSLRPESLPRAGSRGGQYSNPSVRAQPLDSDDSKVYTEYVQSQNKEIESHYLAKLAAAGSGAEKGALLEEYISALESQDRSPPSEIRSDRIKQISSNPSYNALAPASDRHNRDFKFPGFAPPKNRRVFENEISDGEISDGEISDEILKPPPEAPILPLRESHAGNFFSALGARFVRFQDVMLPAYVTGAAHEYSACKNSSAFFDESFHQIFHVTGADRFVVANHFFSGAVKTLRSGECREGCLLDSKGNILDMATVVTLPRSLLFILNTPHFTRVVDYLSQYITFARTSGLDVKLREEISRSILGLRGPQSAEILQKVAEKCVISAVDDEDDVAPNEGVMLEIPNGVAVSMKCEEFTARVISRHFGFTLIVSEGDAASLLAAAGATPAGLHALDMLRMERGEPRPGVDVTSLLTPVSASLVSTIDQSKMRLHTLFGWKRLFSLLAKGPTYRRVGVVLDRYAHAGCRILSCPDRRPIGEVTSCAWNPTINKRVCQVYVKPEYAKEGRIVTIDVPYDNSNEDGKVRKDRSVAATVIRFPLERLDEDTIERKFKQAKSGRSRRLNPSLAMKRLDAKKRVYKAQK